MPYGLVASKINTDNIFDGCLNEIRNEITDKLPEGKSWFNGTGIKGLFGSVEECNEYPTPWKTKSETWIEIYTGSKWINPSAYSLMGRRQYDFNLLKGWNFSGLNKYNEWVPLHSDSNNQFKIYENRTYLLRGNEAYKGFKIEMTESDSSGAWALCIGQIEVFGNIYRSYFIPKNGIFKCTRMRLFLINSLITSIHLILIS